MAATPFPARYHGFCAKTGARILPGDLIRMAGRRPVLVERRGGGSSDLIVIGDREFIRNRRGRCEDAPCCGCCTI